VKLVAARERRRRVVEVFETNRACLCDRGRRLWSSRRPDAVRDRVGRGPENNNNAWRHHRRRRMRRHRRGGLLLRRQLPNSFASKSQLGCRGSFRSVAQRIASVSRRGRGDLAVRIYCSLFCRALRVRCSLPHCQSLACCRRQRVVVVQQLLMLPKTMCFRLLGGGRGVRRQIRVSRLEFIREAHSHHGPSLVERMIRRA